METKRFILLDIDYFTKKGEHVVRLFGKLEDGRSIIVLDKNFKPYIYVLPHEIKECIDELKEFNLNKIEKIRKMDNGNLIDFLKVTLEHPRDMLKLEKEINELKSVKSVREYDIPFSRRYLIDKGIFPMSEVEVQGKILKQFSPNETCIIELEKEPRYVKSDLPEFNILSFKIETCNSQGIPKVKEDPIILISFCSNQGFQKVFSTKKSSSDFVETVPTEEELLNKFVETIKTENPDIITGYNSDKFDFPYIKSRADQLGVSLNLGIDGSKLKFIKLPKKSAVIKGRVHVDLYRIVRMHLQLNSHTIGNVYFELFGEDKVDIPMDQIYTCWIDEGENLERLFRYSLEDAIAVSKIGERMLPMSIELSRIVGQTLFDIVRRGTGTQVKWFLIRKSYEFGYICPNEPGKFERNVVGGYVEEPVKGLHENIHYFDFRSLYPSIIIAKNISPETLCYDGDEESCHIAPEFGYMFKKEPKGFIPTVTAQILNDRIRIKSMMKESEDPEEKQILNFRQEALKTLISTIYGLYNHPKYRWYCVEASEAITAWGRDYLQNTMKKAERFGFKVLYADTDGFFVTLKD
ncbi:3'-5' exonuclease [Methanobacterium oryzae]|uniref:3'-5' exonuclease n=1 Tax=Methanobacterium oryzae TaxID=69540 RepID=UPI003D20A3DF